MLKETIHFKDFNDEPRTAVEYFNLTEKEIIDLQAHSEDGIQADLENAIKSNNPGQILDYITNLVHISYGRKSADGLTFEKTPEILARFVSSAFYSDFMVGLLENNGAKGQEFIQGVMPKKLLDRALAQSQGQNAGPADRTMQESTVYAPSARENFNQLNEQRQQNASPSNFQPGTPTPVPSSPPADPSYAEFLKWQETQKQTPSNDGQVVQASEPYRVPQEESVADTSLPRPPHESHG